MCSKKSSQLKSLKKKKKSYFSSSLTFKEDKIPFTVFINCINAGRQSPPEVRNLHGVSIHHPVVSDSPKPLILETKYMSLTMLWGIYMWSVAVLKILNSLSCILVHDLSLHMFAFESHPHITNVSELVFPWGRDKPSTWTMRLV